ncbi:MFS transporter [Cryptosporangium aurantiacum]|uniref:Predicted arabinose efflux permease, MFS family n=1 Tax=Cryptosporangium aurantiacum TaxID=134849 RepID=A0A1M7MZW0_9ACTN|nr:MFS transporter [Cryptosporangium aurantiacum]SHM96766.1 Predicted arabinose efflux permease, MFS family [Cryptosporangium aurantiacum]
MSGSDTDTAVTPRWRRVLVDTRPLRNTAYRRLFLGQSVSFIGYQVTAVAIPVQMYAITDSSFWVGMIGLAALVPLILFGLWGGAVADAIDRRTLLLISSVVVWVATCALVVQALFGLDNAWLLLALTALQSGGFAVSGPTRSAIIPRLVSRGQVAAANTLNFTAGNFGTVVGPLLAGLILAQWSYAAAYAVDAVLFTVALYAAIRLPHLAPTGERVSPGLRAVGQGLAFIVLKPVLLMSFAVDIIAMVFAMPRALFPQVADEWYGGGEAVGWLYAAIAIGAVLAGLSSGWIGRVKRQGLALTLAVIGWGVAVAAAGLARQLWLAVALLALAGAADLVSAVYRQTILQVYAPDEMRGRMQGVFMVVVAGGPRLGDLRAGATESWFGPTVSWVGGGLVCVVLVILLTLAVPRFLRYDGSP